VTRVSAILAVAALALGASPANPAPAPVSAPVPARVSAPVAAPVSPQIPVALLIDLSNGQTLYSREEHRRFVPASVTKVMTAYTAFKLIEDGALALDRRYLYPPEIEKEWYAEGSNMFLRAGEQPTIAQLLLGVTTVSGNDASEALAVAALGSREAWLTQMNANAEALGMRDTHFGSPNGYPDGGSTFTTARDLAVLGQALTQNYPGLYRRFFGHRQLTWRGLTQNNHDPVTGKVAGADGMKTGFTYEAGYTFLGSAERNGRRLVMVLAGAPSGAVRNASAVALLEWGFSDFEQRVLVPGAQPIGVALVQDGAASSVELRAPNGVVAALPRGSGQADYTMTIHYRGPVAAPIAAGDTIARLEVTIDGAPALDIPLVAAESVAKANVFQRIANGLSDWLG
jgi:D-alanyl-D-alanine carboxypeptidase (penicillin-binding protein 5/6)